MNTVGFVILHYVAFEETINCVDSILKNIIGHKRIVIVDNNSPNDSFIRLKEKYKYNIEVDIIKTNTNIGFAKGNNFGYKYLIDNHKPDFIVVMNNDMEIIQKDFIEEIYQSYKKYQYHICGPDIYSTQKKYHQNPQTKKLLNIGGYKKIYFKLWIKNKLSFLFPIKYYIEDIIKLKPKENPQAPPFINKVVFNPMLHGSCYIFSPLYLENHNDECFFNNTFMYMEAEILYYLAQKHKEKIIYNPNMQVFHHEDISTEATYNKKYKKSIFTIKCLLQSTKVFIDLMKSYNNVK